MAEYQNFRFSGNYTPAELRRALNAGGVSMQDYRQEYQRLYRVTQKRLRRFESAGMTTENSYQYYNRTIKPSTQLSDRDLIYALADAHAMLTDERGSVSGIKARKKRKVQALREGGLTFINNKNIDDFNDFMREAREQKLIEAYGSEEVVKLFRTAVKLDFDPQDIYKKFDYWMENRKKLAKIPKRQSGKSSRAYTRMVNQMDKKKPKKKGKK